MDDNKLISDKMNTFILKQLYDTEVLSKHFYSFLETENNCKLDIIKFIVRYAGIIVNNNLIKNTDINNMGLDVVVKDNVIKTTNILQNLFAAGVIYGKARSDENFYKQMYDISNANIMSDLDIQIANLLAGLTIDGQFPVLEQGLFEDFDEEEEEE